jgi:acetylornithine deacetylase/succinyl-diaminopimelate desuccinylase-like protein
MHRLPGDLTKTVIADTKALMMPHEEGSRTAFERAGNLLADADLDPQRPDPDVGPLLRASTGTGGTRVLLLGRLRAPRPPGPRRLRPRQVGYRLFGRGALDTGGVAVAIAVLRALRDEAPGEVSLILSADDEAPGRPTAFQRLAQRLDSPWDLVVALAPTNLRLATRAKGEYPIRYAFRGRRGAAPLSDPDANAFAAGSHFLTLQAYGGLSETSGFLSARMDGFAIPAPTLTLTGGTAAAHSEIDGIPGRYDARAVLRPLPGQDPRELVQGLRAAAGRYRLDAEIELEPGRPAVDTPEDDAGVRALRRLLAFEPAASTVLVGCDEGHDGAWQPRPAVALGVCGDHSPGEHLDLNSIWPLASVLSALPFELNPSA